MSSVNLWTPAPGMPQIAFLGYYEFRDIDEPMPSKDEWGIDVLDRVVRGPGKLFAQYGDKLKQGQVFKQHFYLQTWRPLNHPVFPGFQLTYKGFKNGAIMDPLPETTFSELLSTINASGLSVSHAGKTIVSASQQRQYVAPTTLWRYVRKGKPSGPKYGTVDTPQSVRTLNSSTMVTFSDGTTQQLTGNVPVAVATALSRTPRPFIIGPTSVPIFGTPYYECLDVVQLKYPDA